MTWYNIKKVKPMDGQRCLIWDKKLSFTLASWNDFLMNFVGNFSGFHPKWWCPLHTPMAKKRIFIDK